MFLDQCPLFLAVAHHCKFYHVLSEPIVQAIHNIGDPVIFHFIGSGKKIGLDFVPTYQTYQVDTDFSVPVSRPKNLS